MATKRTANKGKATGKKKTAKKTTKKTAKKQTSTSTTRSKKTTSKVATKKTPKKTAKKTESVVKADLEPAVAREPKKPKPPAAMKKKFGAFREMLLRKKEELSRHLQSELLGLEASDKHHLADLEEMASDTQDTDSVCEIMEIGAHTLEQIDKALTRIDAGSYGLCEECSEAIPVVRLEALPFATLCISCKRKEELAQQRL